MSPVMYSVPEHDSPPSEAPHEPPGDGASRPFAPVDPVDPVERVAPVVPVVAVPPFGAAPQPPSPADPHVTWSRGADDLLPAAPRPASRSTLSVRDAFRRRRPQVQEPAPQPPFEPAGDVAPDAAAPVPGVTPDDRASYAFWSRDQGPLADFSDMTAMPDEPFEGDGPPEG